MSNGNFAGGDGTSSNPYLIEDADDLNAIRNNLTKAYKLIKDIDLNISPYNTGTGWLNFSGNFGGSLDGYGHIIKNLYTNHPNSVYLGLLGFGQGATVKNIGLQDINVIGRDGVGALFGSAIDTTIINSYSTGNINGNNYVGGLIGGYNGSRCILINSYSICHISGSSYTGGISGKGIFTLIANSYWDKETSGQATSAAGTGLTTAQMKTPSSFVGWDTEVLDDGVTKVWILKDGEYPKLWFEKSPNKYLIMQNNEYYSLKDNALTELGIPTDNTQKEEWFNDYGVDDLKLALLTPDEGGNKLINSLDNQFEVRMMVPKS
ncbi:hypothetical protein ACFHWD_14660 [Clostridium sp. MT-14]|uniref:hypothetical protein n=1 Tax=Clostridium sp. MT-14 TaxID=3348360 RepID=UPI0035F3781E